MPRPSSEKKKALIIKLGGSRVILESGVNAPYLQSILEKLATSFADFDKVVLVIGGGIRCRMLQAKVESADEKDRVGIGSTWDHAQQLQDVLKKVGLEVMANIPHSPDEAKKLFQLDGNQVMGGLQIGQSTDAVAAFAFHRLSKEGYEPTLIILSNVDHIYTADPKKEPTAKPIKTATITELLKDKVLINDPDKWIPGMNIVIDPVAVGILQNAPVNHAAVFVGNIDDWSNALKFISGRRPNQGTVLSLA